MWKYYCHVMDNLGFPAECDARQMDVVRCVTEVVCPAFEQCLTSGDDDYDTAYESVQDSQDLPMSLYATREQRRKKEIAYVRAKRVRASRNVLLPVAGKGLPARACRALCTPLVGVCRMLRLC